MIDKLLEFYRALFEERDPERLSHLFLQALVTVQNVERGSLWVRRHGNYVCVEATGPQSEGILGLEIPAGQTSVVGWVIEHGEMTIAEPGKDSRHFAAVEDKVDKKSTLILCLPLILRSGEVYGAVEIIDTSAAGDQLNLDKEYLKLLQAQVAIGGIALSNSLDYSLQHRENLQLRQTLDGLRGQGAIIGRSPAVEQALRLVHDYARTDFPVLITGESGTGKELFAREIHQQSRRRDKLFLVQNCSAIPESLLESELFGYKKGAFTGATQDKVGLFEAADGGTVFLDEIGDMPLNLQARILRVLQNHEIKPLGVAKTKTVDVRILSATNKDLRQAIAAQEFREDLFYRLNVLPLHLPPLRERRQDISVLLRYFLERESRLLEMQTPRLTPGAKERLLRHPWRGNIREMENFVKYLLTTIRAEQIDSSDLPEHLLVSEAPGVPTRPDQSAESQEALLRDTSLPCLANLNWEELERAYVLELMERTRWNISKAASIAGLNRSTFDSRMRKLGIRKS